MAELQDPPAGYTSVAAKKDFGWKAVPLLVLAALIQFLVPMVVMFGLMGHAMYESIRSGSLTRDLALDSAAIVDQRLYFVAEDAGGGNCSLLSLDLDDEKSEPVVATSVSSAGLDCPSYVMPDGAALWLVAPTLVGRFERGTLRTIRPPTPLAMHSLPFSYRGRPAALEEGAYGSSNWSLVSFDGADWVEVAPITLHLPFSVTSPDDLRVVAVGDTLHLFVRELSGELHYGTLALTTGVGPSTWENTGANAWLRWDCEVLSGTPMVVGLKRQVFGMSWEGWRRDAGGWRPAFTRAAQSAGRVGFVARGSSDLDFVAEGMFKSIEVGRVQDGAVVDVRQHGGMWLFGSGNMVLLSWGLMLAMMPIALSAGWILSWLMRRFRTREHAYEGQRVGLASPIRRGLAKLVDRSMPMSAVVAASYVFGVRMADMGSPGFMRNHLLFSLLSGVWWLAWIVAMAYLEGRWGQTPGKKLLRICVVGDDLRACGFWRALIRNLMEFIDGLFNYAVGLFSIAFSGSWQRVGDHAAKTIVIDAGTWPRS